MAGKAGAIGIYRQTTGGNARNSTSATACSFNTIVTESDTSVIQAKGSSPYTQFDLKEAGLYLILANQGIEEDSGGVDRTQVQLMIYDGGVLAGSRNSKSIRCTAGEEEGWLSTGYIYRCTEAKTIEIRYIRLDDNTDVTDLAERANESGLMILKFGDWPYCQLTNTGLGSVPSTSWGNALWTVETYIDTAYYGHSTSSNQHIITLKEAGTYLLTSGNAFTIAGGTTRSVASKRVTVDGNAHEGSYTAAYGRNANNCKYMSPWHIVLVRTSSANEDLICQLKREGDTWSSPVGAGDNIQIVKLPGSVEICQLHKSSSGQSVDTAGVAVSYDTEDHKDAASFSLPTFPGAIIEVEKAGDYIAIAGMYADRASGINRFVTSFNFQEGGTSITRGCFGMYNRGSSVYESGACGGLIIDSVIANDQFRIWMVDESDESGTAPSLVNDQHGFSLINFTTTYQGIDTDPTTASWVVPQPALSTGETVIAAQPVTAIWSTPSPGLSAVADVSASVVISTFVVPSPALTISPMNITAEVVTSTFTVPSPTLTIGAVGITAEPVTSQFTVPQPTLTAGPVTITADPVTAAFTVPSPGLSATADLGVSSVTAAFTVPDPTLTIGAVAIGVTPAIATFTVPSPALTAAAEITPDVVTAAWSVPEVDLSVGASNIEVDPVTASWSVPEVTLSEVASIEADSVQATFTVPSPALTASAEITVDAAVATFVVPNPTLSTAVEIAVDPAVADFQVLSPILSLSAGIEVQPATAAFNIPSPTLSATATVTPSSSVATWVVPQPNLGEGAFITAEPVISTFVVGNPVLTAPAEIAASPVTAVFNVPSPTLTEIASIEAESVVSTWNVPQPSLFTGTNITAEPVIATMVIPAATLTASATITAVAAVSSFWVPPPEINAVAAVSLDPAVANWVVPDPELSAASNIQVSPASSNWVIPQPGLTASAGITAESVVLTFNVPLVDLIDHGQPVEYIYPESVVAGWVVPGPLLVSTWDVGKLGDKIYDMVQKHGKQVTIYNATRSYSVSAKVTPPGPVTDEMVKAGKAKYGDCWIFVPAKNLRILLAAEGWVQIDGRFWIINGVNTLWTFKKPGLFGLHLGKKGPTRITASTSKTKMDKKFERKLPKLFTKAGVDAVFPSEGDTLPCIPESVDGEYIVPGDFKNHGTINIYLNGFTLPFTPEEGLEVRLDGIKYIVEAELPTYTGERIGLFGLRLVR